MTAIHFLGVFSVLLYLTAALDDDRHELCSDIMCEEYGCPDIQECEFGTMPDVCDCCYTCARGPGENCGGMYNLAGTCALGYSCQPHPKYSQMPGICVKH